MFSLKNIKIYPLFVLSSVVCCYSYFINKVQCCHLLDKLISTKKPQFQVIV